MLSTLLLVVFIFNVFQNTKYTKYKTIKTFIYSKAQYLYRGDIRGLKEVLILAKVFIPF
tara:strand:+ start:8380 stop:8556 length:177 start_codon:yes stop_codon:yes gene_type:complete